jgi:hypothetical protein
MTTPTAEMFVRQRDELGSALADLILAVYEYSLWEPGRAGHAEAHRKLMDARNVAENRMRDV